MVKKQFTAGRGYRVNERTTVGLNTKRNHVTIRQDDIFDSNKTYHFDMSLDDFDRMVKDVNELRKG